MRMFSTPLNCILRLLVLALITALKDLPTTYILERFLIIFTGYYYNDCVSFMIVFKYKNLKVLGKNLVLAIMFINLTTSD